ncbi:hypothetical protein BKA19_0089 [Blastococcus saxobsidens]|uniref:Uncharacterized protein n=1 Tax=Blastococcus saxobsidens TaxID=138336 RepID=A0A4Q7Y3C8_9ACTN|nr:hypothetical protein BKA19_0089 [Blastococcus saxobsidens]
MPEFPGQRPPFDGPPGNTLALQHGAYSPRKVDPLAAELRAAVLADVSTDYLRAPRYAPALWAWARAEAQVQLLTEYLARAGEETADGVGDLEQDRVRSAYLLLHRAEARALSGRRALGLDPLAAARLGRDRAATEVDVARVMAEMDRREREARERDAQHVDGQVVDDDEDEESM